MKTILYNKILDAVAEVTEVPRDLIISRSKQRDVVEARSLLFHYLYAEGFTRRQVADMTGLTRQCVAQQIQAFPDKDSRSKWLTTIMQEIDNKRSRK